MPDSRQHARFSGAVSNSTSYKNIGRTMISYVVYPSTSVLVCTVRASTCRDFHQDIDRVSRTVARTRLYALLRSVAFPPPDSLPPLSTICQGNADTPQASTYGHAFSLAGCIVFLVIFSLVLIHTTVVGIWKRTWSFSALIWTGVAMEVAGYAARLAMSSIGTVWNYPAFVIQLLFLILGPTFIAAGIAVTFKHIVLYLGIQYSVMRASLYPWVFIGSDLASIIIQAIGGAVSATATSGETNSTLLDVGSGLLTAGVAFQAANMVVCGGLMVIYWWRYRKDSVGRAERARTASIVNETSTPPEGSEETPTEAPVTAPDATTPKAHPNHGPAPSDSDFRKFLWALFIAYMAVLIRCIYR